jgi:hypothetical protein
VDVNVLVLQVGPHVSADMLTRKCGCQGLCQAVHR